MRNFLAWLKWKLEKLGVIHRFIYSAGDFFIGLLIEAVNDSTIVTLCISGLYSFITALLVYIVFYLDPLNILPSIDTLTWILISIFWFYVSVPIAIYKEYKKDLEVRPERFLDHMKVPIEMIEDDNN